MSKGTTPPTAAALFERFGVTFPAGTILFKEGEPGKEMYVIQTGRVQLTRTVRGREEHLATLPAGEFFGEMAIINKQPRSATATAIEESHCLVLDARTFEAMIRGNAEIAHPHDQEAGGAHLAGELAGRGALGSGSQSSHRASAARAGRRRRSADGPGVRVDISVEDLAELIAASPRDVRDGLERLEKAMLVKKEPGSISIAEVGKLGEFLEFLDMKERFGG